MKRVLEDDVDELHANDIRVQIIGERGRFAEDIQRRMLEAEERTRNNQRMTLLIAANYGGRWDIAQAARHLAAEAAAGRLDPETIDEDMMARHMAMADLPAPDLCIRTGGDHRISNFLLWQFAYTELYFCDTFWPDFDGGSLDLAIDDYACRQRRFGRREEAGVDADGAASGRSAAGPTNDG